jgi:hypothetical protein
LIRNSKPVTTDEMIKGKKPQIQTYASNHVTVIEELPDKAWCRPLPGYAKPTADGSFYATDGAAGTGMVLRNEYGSVIFTSCRFLEHCSGPLEAAIQACLEGVALALQHCQLPIIVETDCAQLVTAAKEKTQDRSPFIHLISELIYLFLVMSELVIL